MTVIFASAVFWVRLEFCPVIAPPIGPRLLEPSASLHKLTKGSSLELAQSHISQQPAVTNICEGLTCPSRLRRGHVMRLEFVVVSKLWNCCVSCVEDQLHGQAGSAQLAVTDGRENRETWISPSTTIPGKTCCSTKLSRANFMSFGRRWYMSGLKV